MPSNHFILCHLLLFQPSIYPSIGVFSNESVLHIRWPKYWSFSFNISSSNEYSELISFRIDWFDLLAVQGTHKNLLQPHSSKASILQHSAFFIVQLSHLYMTTGKTIALTRWTFVSKVMYLNFNILSRFAIARNKYLLISWLQSPSTVMLEPKKIKSVTVSSSICHEVMGPDAMIFVFLMLSFKPTSLQSCPTLCDPVDCSLPGSSVGFSRQEYWSGLPFPPSPPRDQTHVSCISRRILYHRVTRESIVVFFFF